MRIFLPATLADLRTLAEGRPLEHRAAYAATSALAAAYPEADEEELEYAVLMAAAEDCAGETAIVIAADADANADASTPGAVALAGEIGIERIASFHVGSAADDDLAWYATQELSDLIAELD